MKRTLIVLAALLLCAAPSLAQEFADVSKATGVADDGLGKGVAFADVDNDGFVDIYISNKGGSNKLFLNNGNGSFTDMTASAGAGIDAPGFTMGSVFGDYDNDGNVDLYLATGGRYEIEENRLFKGNGDGTFTDVTAQSGVGLKTFTYAASFVDYDNDGDLDIYCANYGVGAKNVLFKNNGDGTFIDVTDLAGVGDKSWSWMGVWSDIDNDGDVDLYVVNGRYPAGEPNRLYVNMGDGTFNENSKEAGVTDGNWGLGASFADIDNDGDQDLFVSNYVGGNNLYLNNGSGIFIKESQRLVGGRDGWGKGPTFGDIDNDGDLDLYEGDCKLSNQLYLNDGHGNFKNVADTQPQLQCATARTKGTAFADVDNDGDLDLYAVNWGAENKLFLNDQNDSNWIRLSGLGFGTRVALYDGNQLIASREVRSATGFCAQEPSVVHFGVKAGKSYTVKITAPGGKSSSMNVQTGKTINVAQ